MHFECIDQGDAISIWYASTDERFLLGELRFVDGQGDARPEVKELLFAALMSLKNLAAMMEYRRARVNDS